MSTPERPRPLSPTEVADRLGISRRTVARWTQQGVLPAFVLPNGHHRYHVADVEAAMRRYQPEEHGESGDVDAEADLITPHAGAA